MSGPRSTSTSGSDQSISISLFTITTRKLPILNSQEIDTITSKLGIAPPEMIFGSNEVRITYEPSGWSIFFNAFDALDLVDKSGQGGTLLKVAYAQEWSKMREKVHEGIKEVVRPFDWSYTTSYRGTTTTTTTTTTIPFTDASPVVFRPTQTPIPLAKLRLPDPILFFDEVLLYEDELADNGISLFSVKIRVMPARLLLLARFFLRLDGVVYRIRDTRVYIEFETGEVIREYLEREARYEDVARKISHHPNEEIPGIIRDSNQISELLPVTKLEREMVVLK